MPLIIAIVVFWVAAFGVKKCVAANARLAFLIYRFSGILAISSVVLFFLTGITDKGAIFVMPVLGAFFYTLWLAKICSYCIHNKSESIIVMILKIYFTLFSFIVFPVGLLAKYLYQQFVIDRVQDDKNHSVSHGELITMQSSH